MSEVKDVKYIEFGDANKDAIILLHGGGFSWWNYREIAETLSSNYHIILPILDGHAESNDDFSTIEDNAARIISFIDEHLGSSVLLIGGLSLGGQILLEILSQRKNICRYALVESTLVIPSKFTYSMIKPAFGSCYGLIKHKWFAKLQFRSYRIKQELFEDYFRDTCGISKQNMISFLQANSMYSVKESLKESCSKVSIFVGEKENNAMQKSASIIHNALPGSSLQVLPKMYHGEFSMNHANDYANTVIQMIQN